MTQPLIPPSPSVQDYAAQLAANADETMFEQVEPYGLFAEWLEAAKAGEPNDANAMTLATLDAEGMPDARIVLLKDVDARGFTFFSNQESAKGEQLWAQPSAALVFHWKSLRRQVRVRGVVEQVTAEEADAYFATRARPAQIGAWASEQSQTLPDRLALEKRIAEIGLKFGLGKVPRPPHWSGFRVKPQAIEFWRDRPFRLHERLVFERVGEGWTTQRLYP